MKIKFFLSFILLLIIGLVIYLKYHEWSSLKTLIDMYENSSRPELAVIEENDQLQTQLSTLYSEVNSLSEESIDQSIEKYNAILRVLGAVAGKNREYLNTLNVNSSSFRTIKDRNWLMTGKARDFFADFLASASKYYEVEIDRAETFAADIHFLEAYFKVLKDAAIAFDHMERLKNMSVSEIASSFTELASLEKYITEESVKLDETIKTRLPYGASAIARYSDYLGSYYQVIRDVARGDEESAAYKLTRLSEIETGLSIDWDRVFDEPKAKDIEKAEDTVMQSVELLSLMEKFRIENVGEYPLLPSLSFSIRDLAYCQLLSVRAGLYQSVRSENPNFSTPGELMTALSDIYPKTDAIDAVVDRNSIEIINGDKDVKIFCLDKPNNSRLEFGLTKI